MLPFLQKSLLFCYVILSPFKPAGLLTHVLRERHPLHLSSTEVNINPKSNTIEISCRIFTDDFEDLLGKKYKVKPDLSASAKHQEMDMLIKDYMKSHLALGTNSKNLHLNYLGFENDNEAVIVYLESEKVKAVKKLETNCTLMYDLFDDQTNIFHITMNGKRKSDKLTYPEKKLVSVF